MATATDPPTIEPENPRGDASQTRLRIASRESEKLHSRVQELERELELAHAEGDRWWRRILERVGVLKAVLGGVSAGVVVITWQLVTWQNSVATKQELAAAVAASSAETKTLSVKVVDLEKRQVEDRETARDFRLQVSTFYATLIYTRNVSMAIAKRLNLPIPPPPPDDPRGKSP